MPRTIFIFLFSTMLLPACGLVFPPTPEPAVAPDQHVRAATVSQSSRPEQPFGGGVCQHDPAIGLLASGRYASAYTLLEKTAEQHSLERPHNAQQYCSYLALNLLHLLSTSPYFNIAKAVEYQNRLQTLIEEGMSDEQGLLLSKALNEVMLQHTANNRLQNSIAALRTELQQKEEAIQRLKELTMETGS